MRLVVFTAVKNFIVVLHVISLFSLVSGFQVSGEYTIVCIFCFEGRGSILLRKVVTQSPDHTVTYPKRPQYDFFTQVPDICVLDFSFETENFFGTRWILDAVMRWQASIVVHPGLLHNAVILGGTLCDNSGFLMKYILGNYMLRKS